MTTYVLVPGFWLGAWAWRDVTAALRGMGHEAHPLTLTGLADRAHLASPALDLETHIRDILGLAEAEDLRDVVLVGHSGSAAAVTGAAARAAGRVSRVVYVESGPVPDGMAQIDLTGREFVEKRVEDAWRYPMPSWDELQESGASLEGLGEHERSLMAARATAQPLGTITQPLTLSDEAAAFAALPKTLVSCSFPLTQVKELIAAGHPAFAPLGGPEWELHELPTGHWPMLSRPGDLAALLAKPA
ncbi:alpha/beta hydrolase [Microbispora sp. SCL1-1]|uniref:alpha/beta fold hydrolase n=1 Tax=unclassified Microbispora TaxID=2614687 RepID=UPI0011581632|nr:MULTISPECIES: alpha/beta hydrolase [unclassified Microbispora]NJP24677.1 alpha/beta hydrolase [Microbispora sp. CL1-1]TQS14797.1 alpha/beta hydrolase [Microbispora sp. SCL1-1]